MSTPIPSTLLRPLEEQMALPQWPTYQQLVADLTALGWCDSVARELATTHLTAYQPRRSGVLS